MIGDQTPFQPHTQNQKKTDGDCPISVASVRGSCHLITSVKWTLRKRTRDPVNPAIHIPYSIAILIYSRNANIIPRLTISSISGYGKILQPPQLLSLPRRLFILPSPSLLLYKGDNCK